MVFSLNYNAANGELFGTSRDAQPGKVAALKPIFLCVLCFLAPLREKKIPAASQFFPIVPIEFSLLLSGEPLNVP